jgi:hypothetical protein
VIEELSETRVKLIWAVRISSLRALRLRLRLECELSGSTGLVQAVALSDARLNGAPLLPDAARELGRWLSEWQQGTDADRPPPEQLTSRLLRVLDQIAGAGADGA